MRTVLLLLLVAQPALAQDCGGGTQRELNECANDAFVAADTKLNATYQGVVKRLADNAAARGRLVTAERAWIAYRDAQCAFAATGVNGGSIEPMIVANCRADLTDHHQAELAPYLACEEGDLSCPVPKP